MKQDNNRPPVLPETTRKIVLKKNIAMMAKIVDDPTAEQRLARAQRLSKIALVMGIIGLLSGFGALILSLWRIYYG